MSALRVSAAIPAYQAARSVGDVVRRTKALGFEVLVVDDGSRDDTYAAAAAAGARVVRHPANRGKGRALATAFEDLVRIGFEAVVTLDADGQHLPEEIPTLVRAADEREADLVLGTRERSFGDMSWVRRVSNRASSALISLAAGASLPDIQTGFRLYRASLLAALPWPEHGFDAESAVVVRAARRGFRVLAVPVGMAVADGRATSHYRALRDSYRITRAVVRARLES